MLPAPPLHQDHYLQHVSAPRQHIRATFSTVADLVSQSQLGLTCWMSTRQATDSTMVVEGEC